MALFSSAAMLLVASATTRGATVTDFTFETSQPTTAGPIAPEINNTGFTTGTAASAAPGGAAPVFSSTAGNGSAHSYVANGFATGGYFQFTLNSTNFNGLGISYDQAGSSTGPRDFAFEYSTNGGASFTTLASSGYQLTSAAFSSGTVNAALTHTFDLSTITTLNANANDVFRIYVTDGTSIGGSTIAAAGTDRVDNFIVTGTAVGTASPNVYFDVNGTTAGSGVAGGGSYTFSGSKFNAAADGTGTPAAFVTGQVANFAAGTDSAGISYTVNVDTAVSASGLSFNQGSVTLANAAGGSLTLTGPAVTVASGATATVSQVIAGTAGLNKMGVGTLTLSGVNTYTGGTSVNGGILSISADSNLGDASGGINLGSGTLQTTASITTARTLDGSGSLAPATGTTLTISGLVGSTTAGSMTFSDAGTVALTGLANTTKQLASLTFTNPSILSITGAPLALTSGGITTTQAAGTATVNGAIVLNSGNTHTFSVADGSATVDLLLSGAVTGAGTLAKTGGTGELALTGDDSGFSGTITLGGNTTTGGTISVGSATALGTSTAGAPNATTGVVTVTGAVNFNTGTLSNDTGSTVTTGKALSIGALATGTGAVLAGSPFNFTLNESLYKGSSTQTGQLSLVVNNNTTFSGNFTPSSGSGTTTGLTISGTGTLTLTGANTFVEPVVVSGVTLNASSTTGKALGSNSALSVISGGTLALTTANQVLATAPIGLNTGTLSLANGANHGSGATLTGGTSATSGSAIGLGALTLAGNSTLSYLGMAATATFASFDPTGAGTGVFTLNVTGGNFGTATASTDGTNNRLIFDQNLSASVLADITFNGVANAVETPLDSGFYEITPSMTSVPEPTTLLGGVLLVSAAAWSQRRRLRTAVLA